MTAKILHTSLLIASLTAAALSSACSDPGPSTGSGGATGSGGGSGDSTIPSDTSQAGIEAFLAAGSYRSAPWKGDTAPRPMDGATSPHGRVRVFYNPTAITSRNGGENDFGDDPGNAAGSMAVKELYDTSDTLLGKAVMLRTTASGRSNSNPNDWTYYCSSTAPTCIVGEGGPFYGTGITDCSIRHGGVFLSPLPP